MGDRESTHSIAAKNTTHIRRERRGETKNATFSVSLRQKFRHFLRTLSSCRSFGRGGRREQDAHQAVNRVTPQGGVTFTFRKSACSLPTHHVFAPLRNKTGDSASLHPERYLWCAFSQPNRTAQGQVCQTSERSHSHPNRWFHTRHNAGIRRVWYQNQGSRRPVHCEAALDCRGGHQAGHQGRKRCKGVFARLSRHSRLHKSTFTSGARGAVLTPHIYRATKRVWVRARERSNSGQLGMVTSLGCVRWF